MMDESDKHVEFIDHYREPRHPFHREHPWGLDIDISEGRPSCLIELPWPAPRCGLMFVHCKRCDCKMMLTVAGRVDDPRSLRMPCKKEALDA